MNNRTSKIALLLLFAIFLTACSSEPSQTVQATRTTTPTETSTATPREATATWYLKTATPVLPTPPPDDIGYSEGIIVITEYYTFLGHGLYEEAYKLKSSSAKERYRLEEYIENGKKWFKKVELISIVPQHSNRDSMNKRIYVVSFIAWGEGRLSGAAISGEVQTVYLTLIKEEGEWKIE